MTDLISREKAIHELRNALYKYEDENEEKYIKNNNTDEWFLHIRPAVQDMNDIDVQTIVELPSAFPWHTGTPPNREWVLGIFRERDTGWINPIPFVCEYLGFKTEATTKEYWIIKDCTDIDHPCDYFNDLQCIAWQKITPFEASKEN